MRALIIYKHKGQPLFLRVVFSRQNLLWRAYHMPKWAHIITSHCVCWFGYAAASPSQSVPSFSYYMHIFSLKQRDKNTQHISTYEFWRNTGKSQQISPWIICWNGSDYVFFGVKSLWRCKQRDSWDIKSEKLIVGFCRPFLIWITTMTEFEGAI